MKTLFEQDDEHNEDICPTCNQKIRKLNPHHMSKASWNTLRLLCECNLNNPNQWVRIEAGRGMQTNNGQWIKAPYRAGAHATYLKWYGLVEVREHRSALYRITNKGIEFLKGIRSVPKTIWCRGGKVVQESTERVTVQQIRGIILTKEYWDKYANVQVHHPHK